MTRSIVLAAAPTAESLLSDVMPWVIALIGLTLVGGLVIYVVRRSLRPGHSSSSAQGFTLQNLRDLHAAGELTDAEFERARSAMIGRLAARGQGPDARPPAPPPPGGPPGSAPPPPADR